MKKKETDSFHREVLPGEVVNSSDLGRQKMPLKMLNCHYLLFLLSHRSDEANALLVLLEDQEYPE